MAGVVLIRSVRAQAFTLIYASLDRSRVILLEERVLAQAIGVVAEEAVILEIFGAAKFTLGDVDEAERFQMEALVLSRATGDQYTLARAPKTPAKSIDGLAKRRAPE